MTSFWCFYCRIWPESVYQYRVSTFNFKHVFVSRVYKISHDVLKIKKWHICFAIKVARSISFSGLSLHWIEINFEQMIILWIYYKAVESFLIVGVGGWVIMSVSMFGQRRKTKKKHWLKRPKAVPKKEIQTKI